MGYPNNLDASYFNLHVTYLSKVDFRLIFDQAQKTDVKVTLDNDLGPFYRVTMNNGFQFYIYGTSTIFFIIGLSAIVLLIINLREKGLVVTNSFIVSVCLITQCLVYGFKLAYQGSEDFYLIEPNSLFNQAMSGTLFWFPISVGSTAYTYTSFAWVSTMSVIEQNNFLKKINLPLKVSIITLIPTSIVFPFFNVYFPGFPAFYLLCSFFLLIGVFESFVFGYYGHKILKIVGPSHERQLTIFTLVAVVSWSFAALLSLIFIIVSYVPQSTPKILVPAIFRDILIAILATSILIPIIIWRGNINKSNTSSKEKNILNFSTKNFNSTNITTDQFNELDEIQTK